MKLAHSSVRPFTLAAIAAVSVWNAATEAAYVDTGFETDPVPTSFGGNISAGTLTDGSLSSGGFRITGNGGLANNWQIGVDANSSISITNAPGSTSTQVMKFTDNNGTWLPQAECFLPSINVSAVTLECDFYYDAASMPTDNNKSFRIILKTGAGTVIAEAYLKNSSAAELSSGQWYHFKLTTSENGAEADTYSWIVTDSTGEQKLNGGGALGASGTLSNTRVVFGLSDGYNNARSTVYLDNVKLDANPVPEPAALSILSAGALALLMKRH